MNRRDFIRNTTRGVLAGSVARAAFGATQRTQQPAAQSPSGPIGLKKANLKLGTQHGDSDDILKVMAAFGVEHICALPPVLAGGQGEDWSVDGLSRKREHIESF